MDKCGNSSVITPLTQEVLFVSVVVLQRRKENRKSNDCHDKQIEETVFQEQRISDVLFWYVLMV